MSEDDELSCVVGNIYAAALDPVLWTDALAKIAEFVGGPAGALGPKDMVDKFVDVDHHVGLDLKYMQMQSETFEGFDSLATVPLFDVAQAASLQELRPNNDCRKGRSDQEWARPQQWGDTAGAVLERSKSCEFLSVVRSAALFLIDANGLLVHVNAAGRGILGANDFLRSIGGRLVARDMRINRTLQEIFADSGGLEIGSKGIALLLTSQEGECHVAHVLPLAAGARRRAGAPGTVAAAMFVRRATLETLSSPDVIRRAYQLTPTELRVLLAIVNIGGIPEVATALGVADTTI